MGNMRCQLYRMPTFTHDEMVDNDSTGENALDHPLQESRGLITATVYQRVGLIMGFGKYGIPGLFCHMS